MNKIKLVGVPSNAGGLYTGTEMTPNAIRQAGLVEKLREEGIEVVDLGDLNIPSYIPRHNVAPIRNWPAPRVIWEEIEKVSEGWFGDDEFIVILGGDCSIVTGTINSLSRRYIDKTYLVVVDAHMDVVKPNPERCVGAAAMGLWFLLEDNSFIGRPKGFSGEKVTMLAYQEMGEADFGMSLHPLNKLRERGIKPTVDEVLKGIPKDGRILVHLDLDAIIKDELYAVYSPSDEGLSLEEAKLLLREILLDPRVVGIEITEFSGMYDPDGSQGKKLAEFIVDIAKSR